MAEAGAKVIVLMSTYNGEAYLQQQIDSILAQEGDFELKLLVRDDGSKNGTLDILKKYEKEGSLSWYHGKNIRTAKSFLNLLKTCEESDYYAFSDQDDYWFPDKIQKGLEDLEGREKPAIYFSNAALVESDLREMGKMVYRRIPENNVYNVLCAPNVLGCTMIFNHSMAQLIRQYPEPKRLIMHDAYLAAVCMVLRGEIIYDHRPGLKYRQHGNNVLGIKNKKVEIIRQRISEIFRKQEVSIQVQAKEILDIYENIMPGKEKEFVKIVSEYNRNLFTRIALSISRKTKYITKNMAFTIRMSIFLGKR